MKYMLLIRDKPLDLVAAVNEHIGKGWKPYGNLICNQPSREPPCEGWSSEEWIQAMIWTPAEQEGQ